MSMKFAIKTILVLGLIAPAAAFAQQAADPHHPATEQATPAPAPASPASPAVPAAAPQTPMSMMSMMGDMMKMMSMGNMGDMGSQPKGDAGPASQAFNGLMQRMHQGMQMTYTGNADADFAKAMIPHHQGAIDMAKVVVAFGKDPEVRKMAEAMIKAQEAEVSEMQSWLKAHGH